jgi:hypothetical protein
MDQAPTAAKLGAVTDLVSVGVSAGLAGWSLADFDEGPGVSLECEELWLTLAFFFFLSKAMRRKVSEITSRRVKMVNNTCRNCALHVLHDFLRLLDVFIVIQPPLLVLTRFTIFCNP